MTDYAEEKEIVAASTAALDDAIATVRKLDFYYKIVWKSTFDNLESEAP